MADAVSIALSIGGAIGAFVGGVAAGWRSRPAPEQPQRDALLPSTPARAPTGSQPAIAPDEIADLRAQLSAAKSAADASTFAANDAIRRVGALEEWREEHGRDLTKFREKLIDRMADLEGAWRARREQHDAPAPQQRRTRADRDTEG